MPSISLQKLRPGRSLRRLQTVFNPSDSVHDTTSPHSSSPTSAATASIIDFRGLDKKLNASMTNLILTNLDEHGAWANTGTSTLTPSYSNSSASASPSQEQWKSTAWTTAPVSQPEPRGLRRIIRKKRSKVEIRQHEEQQQVRGDLLCMIEPRPNAGAASGGIEEVLHGEA